MLKKILKENLKIILMVMLTITVMIAMIYFDLKNVISKLGLSPTLWSAMIGSMVAISLTIYLWQKEQKERKEQIEKDIKLQKNLIIRTAYINYFEDLLEQINEFIQFLRSYIIDSKDIFGEGMTEDKILLRAIILEKERKIWQLKYRKYAFKSISIDIYNYKYKEKNIDVRTYMPYFSTTIELNKIYDKKGVKITDSGGVYIEDYNEDDIIKIANKIINDKKTLNELKEFLEFLKADIEERVNF